MHCRLRQTLFAPGCLLLCPHLLSSLGDSLSTDGQCLAGAGAEELTSQAQEGSTSRSLPIRQVLPSGIPPKSLAYLTRSPVSFLLPLVCWDKSHLLLKPRLGILLYQTWNQYESSRQSHRGLRTACTRTGLSFKWCTEPHSLLQ